jgi:hypothetical protein
MMILRMLHGPDQLLDAVANVCVVNVSPDDLVQSFQDAASTCATGRCLLFQAIAYERLAKVLHRMKPNVIITEFIQIEQSNYTENGRL